ncbi:MAG TPA: DUF4142 domain-containing protein [Steroidobacteraceae bacterium]|nr:DUF4142 domain-containing protein [Steroidobacteraceae bacterium]
MKSWTSALRLALLTASPALVIASPGAYAQAASPPSMSAPSAAAGQGGTGADFVRRAAEINLTELQLSKLAMNDSTTPVIIKFSSGMDRDLRQSRTSLRQAAEKSGLGIPTSLDAQDAAMVKRLGEESGSEFDADYAKDMAMSEQKARVLYQAETSDSNAALASYARTALPAIEEHETTARSLRSNEMPGVG